MPLSFFLFQLLVFLFSVIIHEVAHGFVAERLGDPTARLAGRLTLNPLKHLDPFGSVILPLLLSLPALFGQPVFIFGWAKPVPYDPRYLKNPKTGAGLIAAAGPISNLILAGVFAVFFRFLSPGTLALQVLFSLIIYVNILLAVFNLVPIPPLDGSKVLYGILPFNRGAYGVMQFLEQYGLFLLLLFIFFGFGIILPVIGLIYELLTGTPFGVYPG